MIKLPEEYKTFLITGGAGFIGSHICEELVKQGKHIICLDNLVAGKMENTKDWWDSSLCTFAHADVSSFSAIRQYFPGVDIVFHNAASKCTVCTEDPKKDLDVNAWGTLNVCNAARESGIKKVIHASTGSVFDGRPKSYYGVSKQAGECYYRAFLDYNPGFNYTALRYHHVYGSRQDSSAKGGVIPIFISRAYTGKPMTIYGDGKQLRHFTYVKDVVRANFFCVVNRDTDYNHYDLLMDKATSIESLSRIIAEMMGVEWKAEYEDAKAGDIKYFLANSNEIKGLGFDFKTEFKDGLRDTINWYVNKWGNNG